jgi:hypothetical protein
MGFLDNIYRPFFIGIGSIDWVQLSTQWLMSKKLIIELIYHRDKLLDLDS